MRKIYIVPNFVTTANMFCGFYSMVSRIVKINAIPRLFAFIDGRLAGRLSLRHRLNDFLFRAGGHIGYAVLPEYRCKGLATTMLKRALPVAKSLGIGRCLLICDDDNVASRKTIERCGGGLEGVVPEEPSGKLIRRYWIDLGEK